MRVKLRSGAVVEIETRADRFARHMERAATPTAFSRIERCDCDHCAVEDGYDALPHIGQLASTTDVDKRERAQGGKWRISNWLLPGEQVIRDERLA